MSRPGAEANDAALCARNHALITRLYAGFAAADAEQMASCYAADASFRDDAFGRLDRGACTDMWRMLLVRYAKDGTRPDFSVADIRGTADGGTARWECKYPSPVIPGRRVHNIIEAKFEISRESGLIVAHVDSFDFPRWASQAIGAWAGLLAGPWACRCLQRVLQMGVRRRLAAFAAKSRAKAGKQSPAVGAKVE
jgi:hypothetical protein